MQSAVFDDVAYDGGKGLNDWLKSQPNIKIVHTSQTSCTKPYTTDPRDGVRVVTTLILFYR